MPSDAIYLDTLEQASPPEIRVAGLTESAIPPAIQISAEPQPALPPGAREGVFQKIFFTATWLPAITDEPDALGFGDLETGIVFGLPFFRRDTPLLITPQFGAHLLENSDSVDLPSELYDAATEFRHLRKFGSGPWAMDVAATVGYYSDFEQHSSDAIRVSGRGLVVYELAPTTKWLFGVAYLNRAGASILPVSGVIYEPRPDLRLEFIFPRPRVAWRTAGSRHGNEGWVYIAGEFGGGIWSVKRPSSGLLDLVSYSDWRLLVGYERKALGAFNPRAEFGYVFQRELDSENFGAELSLDDTFFARAGVTF